MTGAYVLRYDYDMPAKKRIKDLPVPDRPREKLIAKGPQALSEFELLEVIIGSGSGSMTVEHLAARVQKLLAKNIDDITYDSLVNIKGLSAAKATKLVASIELAKRHVIQSDTPLKGVDDYVLALGDIHHKKQEYLVCLSLDGAGRLIARRVVTIGILDSVLVHPREVFADAITDRAAAVVVGHNHPSGELEPSSFDVQFNQQLAAASRILGIEFLDHIIVSSKGHFSFKSEGMI